MAYRFDELGFLEIHQIVPHKKIKTGFRPFLLIQVDLLVDREILSVHVNNHKEKINSTPHIHTQNLRLDKRPYILNKANIQWSGQRDLNSRLQAWEACTLPLSYARA
jgi:hypothetical protein